MTVCCSLDLDQKGIEIALYLAMYANYHISNHNQIVIAIVNSIIILHILLLLCSLATRCLSGCY